MSANGGGVDPFGPASLSASQAEGLDRACDRFEAEWRSGGRPDVAVYLAGTEGTLRAAMARELVAIDVHWRQRSGERPDLAEYLEESAHPSDGAAIRACVQRD